MTELKPCPFCGGMALLQYGYEYGVYCYRCGVTGPGYETEEAAIAAWNKRVETKEK